MVLVSMDKNKDWDQTTSTSHRTGTVGPLGLITITSSVWSGPTVPVLGTGPLSTIHDWWSHPSCSTPAALSNWQFYMHVPPDVSFNLARKSSWKCGVVLEIFAFDPLPCLTRYLITYSSFRSRSSTYLTLLKTFGCRSLLPTALFRAQILPISCSLLTRRIRWRRLPSGRP